MRSNLPFRKNCEGYFVYDGRIVALNTEKGYVEFPGGGVDEGEDPSDALIREAYEEAGVVIEKVELEKIGQLNFVWGEDWGKTDKQKKRYGKFQGEEMHFFKGKIKELVSAEGDEFEDGWEGEVLMDVSEVIEMIKTETSDDEGIVKYREFQLKILEKIAEAIKAGEF